MQTTRQSILEYLRSRREATVRTLAAHLALTATAVHQHLALLERDGLVRSRDSRGSIGRPAFLYSLSEQGEARFPVQYDVLANALLAVIRERYGLADYHEVLRSVGQEMAAPHTDHFADLSPKERVREVVQLMRDDEIVADWEQDGEAFLLHERTCPYPEVARQNAAACVIDVALVGALTGMDVRLSQCQVRGDSCCTYRLVPLDHV